MHEYVRENMLIGVIIEHGNRSSMQIDTTTLFVFDGDEETLES
jgi:hypothetical protein